MNMKQTAKPKNRSGWSMLTITLILYAAYAYSDPSVANTAFSKSLDTLKMITPILLIVFFLMALLNTFIKPKKVAQYLGQESGLRGWAVALVGGVLCHGSNYVWYPVLNELRKQGARDGLIIAFLYARAIKLPWLPVMIGYFGITFTLVLSIYILLGAWLQGAITAKVTENNIENL